MFKVLGRSSLATAGQNAFRLTIFITGVLILAILAGTYQSEDPLFRPPNKISTSVSSDATFKSDGYGPGTGEGEFRNAEIPDCEAEKGSPIDCRDPEIFQLMMMAAIGLFKDIHFSRFGKSVRGSNDSSCDMAWRYRPKEGNTEGFFKDYRSFVIARSDNCSYTVVSIGDYHSGLNARKRKKYQKPSVDAVNDSLPLVESESEFARGRYLIYAGGGDRCKSMNHYLKSFLCALGEALYLRRTLVMDLSICLSSIYTSSNQDEEGKDFRFYFDFQRLKESASVLDQIQFWLNWEKWQVKDNLGLHLVEDYRISPMKLVDVKDSLIMRKFGALEPDNYWYNVCEGEAESIVKRPWHFIRISKRLMDIVSSIAERMNSDFDSVHLVRGEKAKNSEQLPNLALDTSPNALLSTLQEKTADGRNLYIATSEPDVSFFDPLKEKYTIHFLNDFSNLWDENSKWYGETKKLNNGIPVEFDGYMRVEVDSELFLRGKKQVETSNNLSIDCKDGINTCHPTT